MAAAGAEHDIVGALAVHVRLVKLAVKMLDVAATTVDVLLMLHGELDHQRHVPVNKCWRNWIIKMTNDNTFGKSDSCYLLTGNLLLADVVLLDKDGTRVFKASIAEVKNQGCPVGGLAVSTGTFWQTWFHLLTCQWFKGDTYWHIFTYTSLEQDTFWSSCSQLTIEQLIKITQHNRRFRS